MKYHVWEVFMETEHLICAHILLAITQSHDYTELQTGLESVVQLFLPLIFSHWAPASH